ncbi:heparan-alpha-glucosaminide N-acetyltransferase [Colias croceus]|uniref:heparan-alpha-glucosaminide N-acetyltransferase n=1 Tax=Colias crocea TaxID=72248 RepID=UPI001E27EA7B|nr:heparan-alpha-glucosaminide N-acetyltransferase [Colias croceus]XP_045492743.1 heparan-alpha-glucosaminide N-acetyltransferase [Colias croceus]
MNESAAVNDTWQWYKDVVRSWLEDPGVEEFQGLNISSLMMDQAYVVGEADRNVAVYSVSDDCFRCPFELQKSISAGFESWWVVDTAKRVTWRVYMDTSEDYMSVRNTSGLICQLRPYLGEFGVYTLNVTGEGCDVRTTREPVDIYMPLLLLLGLLLGIWVVYGVLKLIMSRVRRSAKLRYGDKELAIQQRLRALDTFRGMAIVFMIFVNDGAGGYWWLEHATWNGLAVGDLVFPAFLWIMGVCVPLSVKSAFAKGIPRWKIFIHIVRRSIMMFLLGVSLNTIYGSNMLSELRIFGVLQRLAVAYLIAAGFYALTAPKYYTPPRGACGQALKDILSCMWCWVLAAVLIALHSAITFIVHDPNCPAGYLGPGGKHDDWVAPECSGGAAGYIDRLLLGKSHMYQHSDARRVYGGPATDPEGLLGCLTSAVQALAGIQAGATAVLQRSHKARVSRWLAAALALALAAALLAGFSRDHGVVPINKSLWSISYVLATSAVSLTILSITYTFTDAWRLWAGGPFRAPGLNAIALYIGHSLCAHLFPFHWKIPVMRTHAIRLIEAVWGTALWVIIAHVMAKKKVFITL